MTSVERERISDEVHDARFLWVCADGSTDKSIMEQETVYIRYVGLNGRPTTQFADIASLESADAVGVTAAIEKGVEAVDVDKGLLREKLASCNFDGCNVMMASYFRVFDPREMPQERSRLASHGNNEVKLLVEHFETYFTDEEKMSIIAQWPPMCTSLARQKSMSLNNAFSNLLFSCVHNVT